MVAFSKRFLKTNCKHTNELQRQILGVGHSFIKKLQILSGIGRGSKQSWGLVNVKTALSPLVYYPSFLYFGRFWLGPDLKKRIRKSIKRLILLKVYRGTRHQYHLPVRGQRSKTNHATQRLLCGIKKPKNFNANKNE